MPQQLYTFNSAQDLVHMQWKEPYVTEGINQRDIAVLAKGTYRGFRLSSTISTTTLTINADPIQNDHVAVVYDTTGTYALELRRLGGSFTASLLPYTNATYSGQTIYVTLVGTYATGATTAVYLQTYTATEFAAAPEAPYVAVLGTVVIGTSSPYYPSSISLSGRTEAWSQAAPEASVWTPVLFNGGFDRGPSGTITPYSLPSVLGTLNNYQIPAWNITAQTAPTGVFSLETSDTNPSPGPNQFPSSQAFQWQYGMTAQSWTLNQYIHARIRAGQLVNYSFWIKGPQGAPTGGSFNFIVRWLTSAGVVAAEFFTLTIPAASFTTNWLQVTGMIAAPSDAAFLWYTEFQATTLAFTSTNSPAIRLDDVQIYLETNSNLAPNNTREIRADDIAPKTIVLQDWQSTPLSDFSTSTSGAVLHFDSTSVGVPTAGQMVFQRRDQATTTSAQPFANLYGQLTLGTGMNNGGDTVGESASTARLSVPAVVRGGVQYTLVYESPVAEGTSGRSGCRIYVDPAGDFVFVVNAYWTNATLLWNYDTNTATAFRMLIGANDGACSFSTFTGAGPTWGDNSWTYTNTLMSPSGNASLTAATSFGTAILGTNADDNTVRLNVPADGTGKNPVVRTLIMQSQPTPFTANNGQCVSRIYVAGDGSMWITNNALYTNGNASPWSWDDSTTSNQVYAVYISAESGSMQILGSPPSSPWTDVQFLVLGNIDPGGNWTFKGTGHFGQKLTVAAGGESITGGSQIDRLGVGVTPPGSTGEAQITSLGVGVAPDGNAGDLYVNTSIGVGTSPPDVAGDITMTGELTIGGTVYGTGAQLAATAESAAGSGASISFVGGDQLAGSVTLVSGSSGTGSGAVVAFTFSSSFAELVANQAISIVVTATSSATSALGVPWITYQTHSSGPPFPFTSIVGFTINVGNSLSTSTTYSWNWLCIGAN